MIVERYKRGPISFEEMYELLKKREAAGLTVRNDEQWELWGYDEDVNDEAVRQRTSAFEEWLEREHGLRWPSTGNRRLYLADEVKDYRRKPGKKASGSFDAST
jgi:hypothetical protein